MNTYKAVPHAGKYGVTANGELLAIDLSQFRAGELVKALRDEERRRYPMTAIMRADFPRYGRTPQFERDPDPILGLARIRRLACETHAPAWQVKYGELLQRVVSPLSVELP